MAINFVQWTDTGTGSRPSAGAFNFASNVTAGNMVVVCIATATPTSVVTAIAGCGITNWAIFPGSTHLTVSVAEGLEIWYGTGSTGGSNVVQITVTGGYYAQATEFSGVGTPGGTAQNNGGINPSQALTVTANQLVVAAAVGNNAFTAFTGLTHDYNGGATTPSWSWPSGLDSAYQVDPGTGATYTPQWTSTSSGSAVCVVSFSPAGGVATQRPISLPYRRRRNLGARVETELILPPVVPPPATPPIVFTRSNRHRLGIRMFTEALSPPFVSPPQNPIVRTVSRHRRGIISLFTRLPQPVTAPPPQPPLIRTTSKHRRGVVNLFRNLPITQPTIPPAQAPVVRTRRLPLNRGRRVLLTPPTPPPFVAPPRSPLIRSRRYIRRAFVKLFSNLPNVPPPIVITTEGCIHSSDAAVWGIKTLDTRVTAIVTVDSPVTVISTGDKPC